MNLQNLWDKYDNPCTIHSRCDGDDKETCSNEKDHCYCVGGILAIHNLEFLKERHEDLYFLYFDDIAFPNVNELTNVITNIFDVPNNGEHLDTISFYATKIISFNDNKDFDISRHYVEKLFNSYPYIGEPIG